MTSRVVMARLVRRLRHGLDLAFLVLASIVLATLVAGRVVPLTGRSTFVVSGPSMEPAIHIGSAIVTEPAAADALRVGDVVTVRVGPAQAIFTHRVTRLIPRADGLWIETKGDANPEADPVILPVSAVIGRVMLVLPGMGYAITALSSTSGLGLLGGLSGLLLVGLLLLEDAERQLLRARRPADPASPDGEVAAAPTPEGA